MRKARNAAADSSFNSAPCRSVCRLFCAVSFGPAASQSGFCSTDPAAFFRSSRQISPTALCICVARRDDGLYEEDQKQEISGAFFCDG